MGIHFWSNFSLGAFDALGPLLAPSRENGGFATPVAVSVRLSTEAIVKDFDAEVLHAVFAHACPDHTCSVNHDSTAGDPSQRKNVRDFRLRAPASLTPAMRLKLSPAGPMVLHAPSVWEPFGKLRINSSRCLA